jgi:4,5-DOPA dioxygenase extradiol
MGCGVDRRGDRPDSRRAERVAAGTNCRTPISRIPGEHLLPLMVALGAGGDGPAVTDYRDHVMGWAVSGFRFG